MRPSAAHALDGGTVTVDILRGIAVLETRDADGDITVVHTSEPRALLSLAASLVNAAVALTVRDEGITRGELTVLSGYAAVLAERMCEDGDGI